MKLLIFNLILLPLIVHSQNLVNIGLFPVKDQIFVMNEMRSGNIGVLYGNDGFLIVDTQLALHLPKIQANLEEIGEGKVVYALNTHFHYDHADGNKAFGPMGATIVAHQNTRSRLLKDQIVDTPGFQKVLQKRYPVEACPSITFDRKLDLHFNDETIRLHHVEHAHTDTDVIVQFMKANVLHTGDVFVRYGIPFIDLPNGGSVRGMIEAQSTILSLCDEETLIIPGHGLVCKADEVKSFQIKLQNVVNKVKALRSQGLTRDEINNSKILEGVFGGFVPPESFLTLIQDELDSESEQDLP